MPIKPLKNERKVCDAVTRVLEERTGKKRENPVRPDAVGIGAPIDFAFDLDDQKYAFEHTILETFDQQIRHDVAFGEFIEPIRTAMDMMMPVPGFYQLFFPIDACTGLDKKHVKKYQDSTIAWVTEKAKELHAEFPTRSEDPCGNLNSLRGSPPGVPFDLHLTRDTMTGLNDGRLVVGRFSPPNYDDLRLERMIKALDMKFPKLMEWKSLGATSVLILENRDIALTNHFKIAKTLEKTIRSRSDWPDQIWLVETFLKDEWRAWCLLKGDLLFPDGDGPNKYREFNPGFLNEV